ncbi:MAG: lytic transglycosylase domain-containing protein [Clostridia bacterium]|nr:lytic transglycosylase domain-containing protein [Clostridia bacterium]
MKSSSKRKSDNIVAFLITALVILTVAAIFLAVAALFEYLPSLFDDVDEITYPLEYKDEIEKASEEFDVPIERICAVIYVESRFDPSVTSSVGARGLMQIMPETFADVQKALKTDYTDDDLYDPAVNIRAGTYYLSYLYKILGDWELVHAAYNAGIGNVWSWLDDDRYSKDGKLTDIPFGETKNYLKKVAIAKEKYKELYFSK